MSCWWNIGITGNLWNWFNCYLQSRTHVSLWETINLTFYPCSLEYPRIAYWVPFCFLVFINHFPSVITSQILEFAIYMKCFRQIISTADIKCLQDLNSVFNWSVHNLLSFNLSKFIFMSFHHKFHSQYTINGHTIKESSSCKDLGIVFTNTLTWREHYEMISAKTYQTLGLLCRVFKNSQNPQTRMSLYITFSS